MRELAPAATDLPPAIGHESKRIRRRDDFKEGSSRRVGIVFRDMSPDRP